MNDTLEQNLEQLNQPEIQEQQPEVTVEQSEQQKPKETDAERNFKAIREKMSRLEKERNEYYQRLQELQNKHIDDEINLGPDEIAEGKHIAKLQKKVREMESHLKNYQQQSAESVIEQRLKSQFPDFDKVVNAETIKALSDTDPELATTIGSNPDLYTKAVTAYRQIKRLGISPDSAYDAEKAKVTANQSKPRTVSSLSPQQGESPLARANAFAGEFTPELQKKLYQEMVDAIKKS